MMFWLFIAVIALTALIAGLLVAYALAAPHVADDDEIRRGEAEWMERDPSIRFRRIEGHDH